MKKLTLLLTSLGLIGCVNLASATNLVDVFKQAQASDPTYQQARATYLSAESTVGQARSLLLPNLGLTGSWSRASTRQKTDADWPSSVAGQNTNIKTPTTGTDLTLQLDQPLFNWQAFKAYEQVKLNVKQAAATYAAAEQSLIMNTAGAYFSVLQAQDVLRYTAAQRRELKRQLQVSEQRYHVGLDAVTAVYDARAQYDTMRATYIAAENSLANKKEELRQITGQLYTSLDELKDHFPLLTPKPANINQWTQAAENQNLDLLAARYATMAAKENVKTQFAGHYPTLDFNAALDNKKQRRTKVKANQTTDTTSYGIQLNVPIFAGGNVNAEVKQAQYDYQAAVAAQEFAHRQVIADTRKAYLGVIAEISQIQADRQAIKSARAALASNRAGYKVGTQTILNVLNAQSTLYEAETTYAQDRFSYVIDTLTLKQAAGTLNAGDVASINNWLTAKPVRNTPRVRKHRVAPKHIVKKHAVKKKPATKKHAVKKAAVKPVKKVAKKVTHSSSHKA